MKVFTVHTECICEIEYSLPHDYLQATKSLSKTMDALYKDWIGKDIKYTLLFECPYAGCMKRFPLKICEGEKKAHPCSPTHDIDLDIIRDKFGKISIIGNEISVGLS